MAFVTLLQSLRISPSCVRPGAHIACEYVLEHTFLILAERSGSATELLIQCQSCTLFRVKMVDVSYFVGISFVIHGL